jgi:glyoxylase-like metal-dependent hydrolase (beta-lactamase superfamily II)
MIKFLLTSVLTLCFSAPVLAHGGDDHSHDLDDVTIQTIVDGLSMIQAGGGNIAVLHGDEGVFVIDNGLPDKTESVIAAIKEVAGDQDITMLVNTHWHFDHAGNNLAVAETGAVIIAHDNVRQRLKTGQKIESIGKKIEPAPQKSLPVLTYDEGVTIHLNGKTASVLKMTPAHTDGDSVIFWKDANVIHTGDIFFNGKFPFIDGSSGGTLAGMIKATDKILAMIDDKTIIIPGHGSLAKKADLTSYNAMLKDVSARIDQTKEEGKSRDEWIASKALKDLNDQWGGGFMSIDKFTEISWDTHQ